MTPGPQSCPNPSLLREANRGRRLVLARRRPLRASWPSTARGRRSPRPLTWCLPAVPSIPGVHHLIRCLVHGRPSVAAGGRARAPQGDSANLPLARELRATRGDPLGSLASAFAGVDRGTVGDDAVAPLLTVGGCDAISARCPTGRWWMANWSALQVVFRRN